jgi:hypothetical protein
MKLRHLIPLVATLGLTGCPADLPLRPDIDMRPDLSRIPIPPPPRRLPERTTSKELSPRNLAEQLKEGDIAITEMKWGKTYTFQVYRVADDSFGGKADDNKKYKVLYEDIAHLTVRRATTDGEVVLDFAMCGAGICR